MGSLRLPHLTSQMATFAKIDVTITVIAWCCYKPFMSYMSRVGTGQIIVNLTRTSEKAQK